MSKVLMKVANPIQLILQGSFQFPSPVLHKAFSDSAYNTAFIKVTS